MHSNQTIQITKKKDRRKKTFIIWGSIIAFLVLLVAVFLVKLPYYIEAPGGLGNVAAILEVDGKEDKESGSYNYTYVSVGQATVAGLVYAWLTPSTEIYSEEEMMGGSSGEDYDRIALIDMETSQNLAEYQALGLAGEPVNMDYLGVYVLGITKNSSFQGVLNIADTVTGVNGKTFKSSKELMDYVSSLKRGSKVDVTYQSEGSEHTEAGKIIKLENGKNGIGISLTDHTKVSGSNHKIEFKTDGLGGPSAGLMFTLSIYTQIKEPDLRDGRVIAGTGSIQEDGTVGDVGGVDKKVSSAAQSGAEIFFVPNNPVDKAIRKKLPDYKNNYETAKEAAKELKTDMKIVPVKTAQEAINYLRTHKAQ